MGIKFASFALPRRWARVLVIALAIHCVSVASGQEITKSTAITIEYWHAFQGTSTHTIEVEDDGTYRIGTQSQDDGGRMKTWKGTDKALTTEDLAPLLAFCNAVEIRRAFAETEHKSILDGDALMVKVRQNKYTMQFHTQPCMKETNTEAERKLVRVVTELLGKANLRLFEPPNWQDMYIGEGNVDAGTVEELFDALRKLSDSNGRSVPVKVYFLSEPGEKLGVKISAQNRQMREILRDIGTSLGRSFRTYHDFAVLGTPEELKRFEKGLTKQSEWPATVGILEIPIIMMFPARMDDMTRFINRKLEGRNAIWRLKCLSHADRMVTFVGKDVLIADIVSVIAADLGEPVDKIFAEIELRPAEFPVP